MHNLLIFSTDKKEITDSITIFNKKFLNLRIKGLVYNSKKKIGKIPIIDTSFSNNEKKICNFIKNNQISILISFQYKWILSKSILDLVKYNAFNFHLANINQYKGHHTSIAPILDKRRKAAVTIHKMTEGVDEGPILYKKSFKINNSKKKNGREADTAISLYRNLLATGLNMLNTFLTKIDKNPNYIKYLKLRKNNNRGVFIDKYKILKNKKINNIKEIDLKFRAFYYPPHNPAYFEIGKEKYYLYKKK